MTQGIQEFDYSTDVTAPLLWQYNSSPTLQSLLAQKQAWYDENQSEFWTDWYNNVFNLQTADAFGLSVWAIILNVPIIVVVQPPSGVIGFGFSPNYENFTHGNFYAVQGAQQLSVEQARLVLRMRYFQLTTRGCIPEINRFYNMLFKPYGAVHLLDNHDMTIEYVFRFVIPSQLNYIFKNYDILARPAGVSVSYSSVPSIPFGFDQPENFDNGNFLD